MQEALRLDTSPEIVYYVLNQVAIRLGLQVDRTHIDFSHCGELDQVSGFLEALRKTGEQVDLRLTERNVEKLTELQDYLAEGFPLVLVAGSESIEEIIVLTRFDFGKYEAVWFNPTRIRRVRPGTIRRFFRKHKSTEVHVLVGQDELECRTLSTAKSSVNHDDDHHHPHLSPVRRFWRMLYMDRRDVLTVGLFALVASILALATPLAVESLVNVVSWGVYLQPLLILSLMLLICLGLGAIMRVLQTIMVEIIQRRQLVRIVSDLAHRFPRAKRSDLKAVYPRELANRIFDIMTIQKATAVLLFDGVSILLTTILGLVLLAVYHPFLLGFDLVLILTMSLIVWGLGRGGIRTAIDESITKYRIVHWLQDVIDSPIAFGTNGGQTLAVDRANRLTVDYIDARKQQFRVVLRQVVFAVGLQVLASTVLLSLGGWLVIRGELTLGQLVASELVVTVVVGAFAKAGKSLEKFYDLMAGIDKVGHLLDLSVNSHKKSLATPDRPWNLCWSGVQIHRGLTHVSVPDGALESGKSLAIQDGGYGGSSLLALAFTGLHPVTSGGIQTEGIEVVDLEQPEGDGGVACAGRVEIFHGTLSDNVALGRSRVGRGRVRQVLQEVGLWPVIAKTTEGVNTRLQTGGYPLNDLQARLLVLARALAGRPQLLVIDHLLDSFEGERLEQLWSTLTAPDAPWTLVVATDRSDLASRCDQVIKVETKQ